VKILSAIQTFSDEKIGVAKHKAIWYYIPMLTRKAQPHLSIYDPLLTERQGVTYLPGEITEECVLPTILEDAVKKFCSCRPENFALAAGVFQRKFFEILDFFV
jgi:hypothetical protein